MGLFMCSKCHCVENTALSNWWEQGDFPLCSECDPEINKWHNRFPKEKVDLNEYDVGNNNRLELKGTGKKI